MEGDRVALRVSDDGTGMPAEKVLQLLADRETLDGELHSLGFVFVRQTVAQLGGALEIESEPAKGTTITVRLPLLPDGVPAPRQPSRCEKYGLPEEDDRARAGRRPREAGKGDPTAPPAAREGSWGEVILEDYRSSESPHPGSIFAIAVTEDDQVDYFTHRPYERLWGITHEDLAPSFFQATVRGRLEEDDEKQPVLILKAPQNIREYFELQGAGGGRAERRNLQPDGPRRVHPRRPQAHRLGPGRGDGGPAHRPPEALPRLPGAPRERAGRAFGPGRPEAERRVADRTRWRRAATGPPDWSTS